MPPLWLPSQQVKRRRRGVARARGAMSNNADSVADATELHPRYADFDFAAAVDEHGYVGLGHTGMVGGLFEIATAPQGVDPSIVDVDDAAAANAQLALNHKTIRLSESWANGTNLTVASGSEDCEIIIPSGKTIGVLGFADATPTRLRFRGPGRIGWISGGSLTVNDILFDGVAFKKLDGFGTVVENTSGVFNRWEFLHCIFSGSNESSGAVFLATMANTFIANCSMTGSTAATGDDFCVRTKGATDGVYIIDSHVRSRQRDCVRHANTSQRILICSTPNGISESRRTTLVNVNNGANWRDNNASEDMSTNHHYGYDIRFVLDNGHAAMAGIGGDPNTGPTRASGIWDLKRTRFIVFDSGVVDAARLGGFENSAEAAEGEVWNYGGNGTNGDGSAIFEYTDSAEPAAHAAVTPPNRTSPLTGQSLGDPASL
jgi:hypothetical protein